MEVKDMLRMANQIGTFFKPYEKQEALEGIAEHLNKFWEPRMRSIFFAHLDAGGQGFDPLVLEASSLVKRPKSSL